MEMLPFTGRYIPEAAVLLARRHRHERRIHPGLPASHEEREYAEAAVQALWEKKNSYGVIAVRDGAVIGYILACYQTDGVRERHAWVDYAGMAIAEEEDAELYRHMYAAIGEVFVGHGCFKHYVLLPSGNPSVADAWFRLGFGHEQVHAVLKLDDREEICTVSNAVVRLANEQDEEAIRAAATAIMKHQTAAPCWAPAFFEDVRAYKDGYAELVADETVQLWVAEQDGRLLGFQAFWPAKEGAMTVPKKCVELGVGATVPEERGKGIGKLLVQTGLAAAAAQGYEYCITDWRMTNLLASSFWPKQGFRPIAYRLYRCIDPRIAWAYKG